MFTSLVFQRLQIGRCFLSTLGSALPAVSLTALPVPLGDPSPARLPSQGQQAPADGWGPTAWAGAALTTCAHL